MAKEIRFREDKEGKWIEVDLGTGWRVAYRVRIQDERPIFAEVRVFPASSLTWPPGEWEGSMEPLESASVPAGGITSTLLRLPVNEHRRSASDLLRSYRNIEDLLAETKGIKLPALRGLKRPGRKGRGLAYYAMLAAEYVDLVTRGAPKPVAALASKHRMKPTTVSDQIHEARRRGLLTKPPANGVAGGILTDKARDVLAQAKKEKGRARTTKAKPSGQKPKRPGKGKR